MTDQELQKIAQTALNKWARAKWNRHADFDTLFKSVVMESITQVRDAQANKLFMAEADSAVVNAICKELEEKLKTAMEALEWIKNQMTSELLQTIKEWEGSGTECFDDPDWHVAVVTKPLADKAKEALEKIGGGE